MNHVSRWNHSPLPVARLRLAHRTTAILALAAANVIWGTTLVATKPMLERVPPLTLATARFAIALLILLALLRRTGARPKLGRTPALLGFTGIFLLYLTQNIGLNYTTATNCALIHGGIPVVAALLAVPILGERLNRRRLGAVLVSIAGVAVVVLFGSDAGVGNPARGDVLLLLSTVAFSAYLVLGRRAFPNGGALPLVAGVTCYGLLFLVPASAIELAVQGMERPTPMDFLSLFYLGGVASVLAYLLSAHGLRHLEAGQAAVFVNLVPLVGVAVAALLLSEAVSPLQLGGGLLILGGVCLETRRAGSAPTTRTMNKFDRNDPIRAWRLNPHRKEEAADVDFRHRDRCLKVDGLVVAGRCGHSANGGADQARRALGV